MLKVLCFLDKLFVLYGIAFAGFLTKKNKILDKNADSTITQLILYITLPALILNSLNFQFDKSTIKQIGVLIFISAFSLTIACLTAGFLAKKLHVKKTRTGVFKALIIFGNQGFLGYAVIYSLLSEQGIMYAAVYNLPFLVLIWTYGIYLIAGEKNNFSWKTVFLNPGIIATFFGLLVCFLPLKWNEVLADFLKTAGSPTTFLSMILIGSLTANLNLSNMVSIFNNINLLTAILTKLFVIPLFLLPFKTLQIKPEIITVAVLISGMPSAPTTPLLAKKFNKDAAYASVGVCVSTLVSIVTLPILYFLLNL